MSYNSRCICLSAAVLLGAGSASRADVMHFIFADVGTTHTGFIFPGNPLIGQEVMWARINLTVTVAPGADAALFDTDLTLPIQPFEGSSPVLALTGAGLGWSGSGTFTHSIDFTTQFNGTFIATLFGAATAPMDAFIHEGSGVEVHTEPVPAPGALGLLGGAGVLGARRRRR